MIIKKENIKQVIDRMIDKDYDGWPPECMGLWYQPYRPKNNLLPKRKAQKQAKSENSK